MPPQHVEEFLVELAAVEIAVERVEAVVVEQAVGAAEIPQREPDALLAVPPLALLAHEGPGRFLLRVARPPGSENPPYPWVLDEKSS